MIVAIFVISLFALKDLWGPKFYTSHDGQSHLARLYEFDRILKEGQFPPRWAGQFSGTRGYPVFIFAYPLPYWLAEGFHFAGFNLAESVKLVIVFSYFTSALGMYFLARELFKNSWAAFVSSILWSWAPYRFVKIFVTASLGEAVGFAFVPLVFLFVFRFSKKSTKKNFVALVFALAGLILSHLITLVIFFPLWFLFSFWLVSYSKKKKRIIKRWLVAILLAVGICSFYLIPAVWEAAYTYYTEIVSANYDQFVSFKKLLYSPWGYGAPGFGNDLTLRIGIAQWLAVFLSIFLIIKCTPVYYIYFIIKKKNKRKNLSLIIILLFNFFLSIFLMLEISKPIWVLFSPLQKVDTPWRFLALSVFTAAFLSGWLIANLKERKFLIFASMMLLILAFYGNRNHLRINDTIDYPDNYFKTYYWVGSGWNEYIPRWARKKPYQLPPEQKVEINQGDCRVEKLLQKSNLISFNLACRQKSEILIHNYYYPGWRLFVDGRELTEEVKENLKDFKKSKGLVLFSAPAGEFQVKLKFGETKLRLFADLLSIAAFSCLAFLIFKKTS